MSTPSITTLPRSGLSSPMRVLSRTDLPVPEGPSITQISPAGTVRETSPQMSCLPKDLVRPSIWISTPMGMCVLPVSAGQRGARWPCQRCQRPGRREVTHWSPGSSHTPSGDLVPRGGTAQTGASGRLARGSSTGTRASCSASLVEHPTNEERRDPRSPSCPECASGSRRDHVSSDACAWPAYPGTTKGGRSRVGAPALAVCVRQSSLEGDGGAGALEGFLGLLGSVLRDVLENGLRG